MPSPYKEQHDSYIQSYLRTGVRKIIGKTRQVEGVTKAGEKFPLMLSIFEQIAPDDGSRKFVASMVQVTVQALQMKVSVDGTILSVNNPRCIGFEEDELLGQNVCILVPSPWKEKHPDLMRQYLENHTSNVVGQVRNLLVDTKTQTVYASVHVTNVTVSGRPAYNVNIHSIDYSVQLVFTLTMDGFIKSCNTNFLKTLLGYEAAEFGDGNHSINEIVPNLFAKSVKGSVVRPTVIMSVKTSCEAIHRDGSRLAVAVTLFEFKAGSGLAYYSCRIQRMPSTQIGEFTNSDDSVSDVPGLILGPVLGRGAYGVVRLGTAKDSGAVTACKMLSKAGLESPELLRIRREIAIMTELDHPNIAKLYNVIETPSILCLCIEFCSGGELCDFIKLKGIWHGLVSLAASFSRVFHFRATSGEHCTFLV